VDLNFACVERESTVGGVGASKTFTHLKKRFILKKILIMMRTEKMYKYLALLATVGFLAGCDCTDGCNGDQNANDSGMVNTDVNATDALTAQLGDKTKVYFDTDKYNVKTQYHAALQDQAAWLKAHAGVAAVVEGHCDERGTREYNLALGVRRANAVKDYLVSLGVDAGRIQTISYGKDKPLVLGSTAEAWAQNRVTVTAAQH